MTKAIHISDLHGNREKYQKLFDTIGCELPDVVFITGDLYPSFKEMRNSTTDFFEDYFVVSFKKLKVDLKEKYPGVFIILGNDDPKKEEERFLMTEYSELWTYINFKKVLFDEYSVFGYSFIPPTPFIYKDWEVYDVSRFADPGCIHPVEGKRSVDPGRDIEFATIKKDLETLTNGEDMSKAIFLFHCPPYNTNLDRADLDNMFFDHVPLDVHIGSIAIKEFIADKQPLISMHGHVHESTTITGDWKEKIGKTYCFNAATEQNTLSLVIFELENPDGSKRILI